MGSHQCREEGQGHLPWPAGNSSFDAAQVVVGFLSYVGTLLGSCPACCPPVSPNLFGRAVLHPYIPQLVLIVGIAMTQVQDHTLGFIEPHEVHLGCPQAW